MIRDMDKLRKERSFLVEVNKKLRGGGGCFDLSFVGEIGFRYVSMWDQEKEGLFQKGKWYERGKQNLLVAQSEWLKKHACQIFFGMRQGINLSISSHLFNVFDQTYECLLYARYSEKFCGGHKCITLDPSSYFLTLAGKIRCT